MITVIHGDDIVSSRNYYLEQKNKAKNPISFDEQNLSIENLVKSIEGGSLFGEENEIFIEEFLSQNKSKIVDEVKDYLNNNSKTSEIYFWEPSEIKRLPNLFKNSVQKLFKLPQSLFLFLDSIKPDDTRSIVLFHQVLQSLSEDAIFYMLVRQFRLMLALFEPAKTNIEEEKRLAPWQSSKLKRQALIFGKEKLLNGYKKLYELDLNYKSGGLSQTLSQNIDFFLLDL